MRALLYLGQCYRARFLAGFLAGGAVPSLALSPASFLGSLVEDYPQGYVTPLSFLRGSAGERRIFLS